MATLILTTVGTAVGGPLGGALGAFLGRQVDRSIFGSGSREGPRLKELAVTTSSYGQPIPRNFGKMRVAGTVIWSTELNETTTKEGGGKGRPSTKTYSYSASFAVALSSTPVVGIGRIWADGNLLRGQGGDLKVGGLMRFYPGTGDNPVDPLISADRGDAAPAFRDCAYVVFEDLQLAEFGNRIPALTFEIFASGVEGVSLAQLVPQIARGEDPLLLQNALGFADEGGAIGSSLTTIDRIYPLTCTTTADGLRFASLRSVPAHVPTLPGQLSQRDSEDAEERHRKRGENQGREPLALRYYDEARDYQPGVQRALGPRSDGREIMLDLPASMTAAGARELANANAQRSRWRDEHIVWRVGELDPKVGAGSIVRLPATSGYWLVESWEWFDRGIELELVRFAPELSALGATDPGASLSLPDEVATPTLLSAFELPPDDTSSPAQPLLHAAASSAGGGWRGAALFVEQGDTLVSIGSTDRRRVAKGLLASPLGGSTGLLLEPTAFIEIELVADDLDFPATDITGLAHGANRVMVGSEILQYLNAEKTGTARWRLTGLLRGRAGTENFAALGHPAGELVVLLDGRLTTLDPSLVVSAPDTRIAAIGLGDEGPVYAAIRNSGISLRPVMPVQPRKMEQIDGSMLLCWTRRARGQWRWPAASEVALIEEREAYEVGFGPVDLPWFTWSVSEPFLVLSASARADLLIQHGAGNLWVRQVGTFSKSAALLITVIS